MATAIFLSESLGIIGSLICFVIILIKIFERCPRELGVACIQLTFVGGLGLLIAFVWGWTNAKAWGVARVMLIWTGCTVGAIASVVLAPQFGVVALSPMLVLAVTVVFFALG